MTLPPKLGRVNTWAVLLLPALFAAVFPGGRKFGRVTQTPSFFSLRLVYCSGCNFPNSNKFLRQIQHDVSKPLFITVGAKSMLTRKFTEAQYTHYTYLPVNGNPDSCMKQAHERIG
jgi:hypothetical protein